MLIALISIFLLALLAPGLNKIFKNNTGWILAILPFSVFVYLLTLFPVIAEGETVRQVTSWVPIFEVSLSFYLDGLSMLFGLLITGIGTFIVLYAGGYLKGHEYIGRFYCMLLLFMGSMLGVVLADNLITLFIFWELTSFSSYLLIGFTHDKEDSRDSALQALIVTGLGGLALLAGLILMGYTAGTFEMSEILVSGDVLRDSPIYLGMLILLLAGAFTKSAQFPFHFWLPAAMAAPTPVSAYLHSATMVKAGVYLLARMYPAMGDTDPWFYLVTGFGAVTLLISAWLALCFTDMKQILAYTTVMILATLTMLIGMGFPMAHEAVAVYILAHALYKASLFMVAGSIDHEAGTRDISMLGGLRSLMPISMAAAALAAISMAGIPPLIGFIGKEIVYEAALEAPTWSTLLITIAVVGNIAGVAAAGIVAIKPFFGPKVETPKHAHEAPLSMWIGPVTLASLGLIFGVLPFLIDGSLMTPTASAVFGEHVEVSLSLWHGINLPLILSVVTLLGGIGVYRVWDGLRTSGAMVGYRKAFADGPRNGYYFLVDGLLAIAGWQTRILQNGMLRYYMLTILAALIIGVGYTFLSRAGFAWENQLAGVEIYEWTIFAVIILSAIAAATVRSRLSVVVSLGMIGFGLALIYLMYGAPDLAMTQILVETLTVILVALVLVHMPPLQKAEKMGSRFRDAVIAIAAGAMFTGMTLTATTMPFDAFISEQFAEWSYPVAQGRNIVNVILVDFRALDTLGEVVVVSVAGLAVYALVKMNKKKSKTEEAGS